VISEFLRRHHFLPFQARRVPAYAWEGVKVIVTAPKGWFR
jgi:hypothetical protein